MHGIKASQANKPTRASASINTKQRNKVLKTAKRSKHNGWKGRILPKVNIPYVTHGPDDILVKTPLPGPYFEDPQGVEPFHGEARGALNLSPVFNNQWRLMAAVQPKPFPAKIGFTRQDTLYTYGRRVRQVEMKHHINAMREMEEQRIERNFQIASRQADEIRDRKTIYQAWRLRQKLNTQYNHTVRMQKHAAALAASYQRGDQVRAKSNLKIAQRRAKYIELLMSERRTTWIEDPENVDDSIFNKVDHPTGWWPADETRALNYSNFDTDDHDIEKYFTTSFPPFTSIRPKQEGVGEFYDVVANGKVGWDLQNEQMMEEIGKHVDLSGVSSEPVTTPLDPIDIPQEWSDAGEVQAVSGEQARAGLRARTFLLHEQMPHEKHGLLRDVQSASFVEKQPYIQRHAKDINAIDELKKSQRQVRVDVQLQRQQDERKASYYASPSSAYPIARPHGSRPLDDNEPSHHRISL